MNMITRFWKKLSIAHKLNFVIGVMATLIIAELFTVRFAMSNLSAARALVGGESLWSKAQKDALASLQRYSITRDEKDFQEFIQYLKVPEGDHQARIELLKNPPNEELIRQGFLQGQVHGDDIPPVVKLLRNFYWIVYLSRAIDAWTQGDLLMGELKQQGLQYHDALLTHHLDDAERYRSQIKILNEQLTQIEVNFSNYLGEGSRWLEHVILFLLTIAVLMVESVGITLALFTNRSITKRLAELQHFAGELAEGKFGNSIKVDSQDEIGRLTDSVNRMGVRLENSYRDLEKKVHERTTEARAAVQMRDEFLSIASHELRTPITSLFLELQLLDRELKKSQASEGVSRLSMGLKRSLRQTSRLTQLLDELLDLTRIQVGKFEIHPVSADLVTSVKDTVAKFQLESSQRGSPISTDWPAHLTAFFDPLKIEQVLTNLISNAIF